MPCPLHFGSASFFIALLAAIASPFASYADDASKGQGAGDHPQPDRSFQSRAGRPRLFLCLADHSGFLPRNSRFHGHGQARLRTCVCSKKLRLRPRQRAVRWRCGSRSFWSPARMANPGQPSTRCSGRATAHGRSTVFGSFRAMIHLLKATARSPRAQPSCVAAVNASNRLSSIAARMPCIRCW